MRRINIPEGAGGIQEVSGSIPLISTKMALGEGAMKHWKH